MDEERAEEVADTRVAEPVDDADADSDSEDEPIVVEPDMSLANMVVVDNIPVAPASKREKLKKVLMSKFKDFGTIVDFDLPVESEKGPNKGFCFIEYSTPGEAQQSLHLDKKPLDKAHILRVTPMNDFEAMQTVPDKFVPPKAADFQPREDLYSWLLDPRARDQFFTKYQENTDINWMEVNRDPEVVKSRQHWTESPLQMWSPKGSYLVTFHRLGVVLWGGPSFERLVRFPHGEVKLAAFSPDEKYLVTFNDQQDDKAGDPQALIVWNVRSGEKEKSFLRPKMDNIELEWPFFKWAPDDSYFSILGKDSITIYDTNTMLPLNKKRVPVPEIQAFDWSPSDPYISYWTPEIGNTPARVVVIRVPDLQIVAQKNLFNVKACKMHWHPQGDFLAVKVDRTTRSKKTMFTSFEFFRIRERDCPVDSHEFKENVIAFAWEPFGIRMAIIHGEGPRASVSFFSMDTELTLSKTLEKKMANTLFWSPRGGHIVLAGLLNLNGTLEFFDANKMETMGTEEHFMATDVEWDPSGRYVTTCVSYLRHQMENGYKIWSFQGKLVYQESRDRFFQVLWRPRPPSLLTKKQIKDIKRGLKQYSVRYDHEDEEQRDAADVELREEYNRLRIEFADYVLAKKREYEMSRAALIEDRGYESEYDVEEEIDETVVSVSEEKYTG